MCLMVHAGSSPTEMEFVENEIQKETFQKKPLIHNASFPLSRKHTTLLKNYLDIQLFLAMSKIPASQDLRVLQGKNAHFNKTMLKTWEKKENEIILLCVKDWGTDRLSYTQYLSNEMIIYLPR